MTGQGNTPEISLIIPVYNAEDYLPRTLSSVAAQDFPSFEVLVVDDGSTDRSAAMAEAYLQTTTLCWRLLRQENRGQGSARDAGVQAATGRYVAFLDADDTVSSQFLSTLFQAAEETGSPVSFCGFRMVKGDEPFADADSPPRVLNRTQVLEGFLLRSLQPILPTLMVRRTLLTERGLTAPPGCRFSEDLYLMWLIFAAAEQTTMLSAPLYHYLRHENSVMTASAAGRILSGYAAMQALPADPRFQVDFPGQEYLLSRWVLGALNSAARILGDDDFFRVAEQMDFRRHLKSLHCFPDWRVRVLSALLAHCPRLYLVIVRRHAPNG